MSPPSIDPLALPSQTHPAPSRSFFYWRRGGEERLQTIWISFNWVPREGWGQLFLHDAFLPKSAFRLCATRGMQPKMHLKQIACFHDLSFGNADINARVIVKWLDLYIQKSFSHNEVFWSHTISSSYRAQIVWNTFMVMFVFSLIF